MGSNGLAHLLNPAEGEAQQESSGDQTWMAYRENGRSYHTWKRGTYPFPCDEQERNRSDMLHHLVHAVILKQFAPPGVDQFGNKTEHLQAQALPLVKQTPYSILDLGTGTGIWACDMAKRFPAAEIVAGDLVGGQPDKETNLHWRTPDAGPQGGLDFEDANWGLTFNSFDLIHAGHLCGSVSDWLTLYKKVIRHLRPGTGQFEQIEIDYTPRCEGSHPPPNNEYWWNTMKRATGKKPIAYREDTGDLLHAAGFVTIDHKAFPLPWTGWLRGQRETAFWYRSLITNDHESGFQDPQLFNGLSMGPLTRNEGWPKSQVDKLVTDVLREVDYPGYRAYHVLHVWTARRPDPNER